MEFKAQNLFSKSILQSLFCGADDSAALCSTWLLSRYVRSKYRNWPSWLQHLWAFINSVPPLKTVQLHKTTQLYLVLHGTIWEFRSVLRSSTTLTTRTTASVDLILFSCTAKTPRHKEHWKRATRSSPTGNGRQGSVTSSMQRRRRSLNRM